MSPTWCDHPVTGMLCSSEGGHFTEPFTVSFLEVANVVILVAAAIWYALVVSLVVLQCYGWQGCGKVGIAHALCIGLLAPLPDMDTLSTLALVTATGAPSALALHRYGWVGYGKVCLMCIAFQVYMLSDMDDIVAFFSGILLGLNFIFVMCCKKERGDNARGTEEEILPLLAGGGTASESSV
jgi:hypothetical protein|eukprot:SAG25_NODE_434_length_8070_cov_90.584117_5_plen_182_part_00